MAFGFTQPQNQNQTRSGSQAGQRPNPLGPGQRLWPAQQEAESRQPQGQQNTQQRPGIQKRLGIQQSAQQGMQQRQGMQQGMQQGAQQRQGMPQGMQQGMPQAQQRQSMPQGTQQGAPQRQTQGQIPRGSAWQNQPPARPAQQSMGQPPARQAQQQGGGMPPDPAKLPDGVTYQPLDDRTINEIRRIAPNHPALAALQQNQQPPTGEPTASGMGPGTAQPAPARNGPVLPQMRPLNQNGSMAVPAAPAFPPLAEPPLPPAENALAVNLEKFIQNEHNGAVYYHNLATIAETKTQTAILNGISDACRERGSAFNQLYRRYRTADYEPVDNPVIGTGTFRQGIFQAMAEENRSIKELIHVYENTADDARHTLSAQIYKKISDLNFLHLIVSER